MWTTGVQGFDPHPYVDEFGCSKLPDRWWPLAFLLGQKRWESTEWIENPEDSFFLLVW